LVKGEIDVDAFVFPGSAEIIPVSWVEQFYDCGVLAYE
jgi:hypothetical protein